MSGNYTLIEYVSKRSAPSVVALKCVLHLRKQNERPPHSTVVNFLAATAPASSANEISKKPGVKRLTVLKDS
jgi:hypothetical protein